jgi:hypothetical protein
MIAACNKNDFLVKPEKIASLSYSITCCSAIFFLTDFLNISPKSIVKFLYVKFPILMQTEGIVVKRWFIYML